MPAESIDVILRLLNNRRFVSGMYGAGRAVRAFGDEAEAAGAKAGVMETAMRTGTGALFALGAASRLATEAVAGIGIAGAVMGIKFDAMIQSSSLAFTKFSSSAQEATKFTTDLFNVAKEGPFSFESILQGSRRLLAFGFNIQQTLPWIKSLSDALSFTGGSQDEILRTVKALGEIRSMGFVKQRQINQLITAGLPVDQVMAAGGRAFSKSELQNIGHAHISATTFLDIFQKGLNEKYKGGNAAFLKTFTGQWQRFTDNLKQSAGEVVKKTGLFDWLNKQLELSNKLMNPAKKGKKSGSADSQGFFSDHTIKIIKEIGQWTGRAFGTAVQAVSHFVKALEPAKPFFENVLLPILKGVGAAILGTFTVGIEIIKFFASALGFLGGILKPFKVVFEAVGFVIGFFFGGLVLKAAAWLGKLGGVFRIVGVAAHVIVTPFKLGYKALELFGKFAVWAGGKIINFISRIPGVGAIFSSVVRGVTHFGQSVKKWVVGMFDNAVLAASNFLSHFGSLGGKFLSFGIKLGESLFTGMKQKLFALFGAAGGFVIAIGNGIRKWLNKHTLFGNTIDLGFLGHVKIPALATGGDIMSGGVALVGERGPELVRLPTGSSVTPMRPATARHYGGQASFPQAKPSFDAIKINVHSPVYIDRRQIGTAMGEFVAERQARR